MINVSEEALRMYICDLMGESQAETESRLPKHVDKTNACQIAYNSALGKVSDLIEKGYVDNYGHKDLQAELNKCQEWLDKNNKKK